MVSKSKTTTRYKGSISIIYRMSINNCSRDNYISICFVLLLNIQW